MSAVPIVSISSGLHAPLLRFRVRAAGDISHQAKLRPDQHTRQCPETKKKRQAARRAALSL
ncbi:MAG: hypothetical protein CMJ35_15650 [Phycisphaerae bacterium]|nr:hypothetical protein [Phycisphaerae bacterium]HCT44755.1 hypothetical protein [Phycisphaerales bacterium]